MPKMKKIALKQVIKKWSHNLINCRTSISSTYKKLKNLKTILGMLRTKKFNYVKLIPINRMKLDNLKLRFNSLKQNFQSRTLP